MKLNEQVSQLIKSNTEYEIGVVKQLKIEIDSYFIEKPFKLSNQYSRLNDVLSSDFINHNEHGNYGLEEYLVDQKALDERMLVIFYENLILSLQRILELQGKGLFSFKYEETEVNEVFRKFNLLKKLLKNEDIEIKSLSYFENIHELILLSNSIKHEGFPNRQLVRKFEGYKAVREFNIDEDYNNLKTKFDFLSKHISDFLFDLGRKLI